MRVTVDLGYFFNDHRSIAGIFLDESIKLINDIELKLQNIFKINNFYLKRGNQFLPPTEDVRLLQQDETICVFPCRSIPVVDSVTEDPLHLADCLKERKKKKKKKHEKSERKSRKRSHEEDNQEISLPTSQSEIPKKLMKTNDESLSVLDIGDSGRDTSPSCNSEYFAPKECSTVKVKPLQEVKRKTINIVKTIIVSNNPTTSTTHEETPMQDEDITNVGNITDGGDESVDALPSNLDHAIHPITNESGELAVTPSNDSDSNASHRRKRKRVRKKKSDKKINIEEPNTLPLMRPRSILLHAQPKLHIKFDDELIPKENGDVVNGDIDEAERDSVNITESEVVRDSASPKADSTNLIESEIITEDIIAKYPITPNLQPRSGDIIAFKILRINAFYEPEVSSSIVGKVSNYNAETKEITFYISYGEDQCIETLGKFSVDVEEEAEEKYQPEVYHFHWPRLIEPRHLFP